MPPRLPIRFQLRSLTKSRDSEPPPRFLLLLPRPHPCLLRCCAAVTVARALSTTAPLRKKDGGGKKDQKRTIGINAAKTASSNDDPRDFSDFHTEIEKATDYLKSELAKLKAGGLDLDAIEGLRVNLGASKGDPGKGPAAGKGRGGGGGKAKGEVVRLGDMAQVVPRGRVVVVMIGEKDHFKPIFSTLSSSSSSLPVSPQMPSPTPSSPSNALLASQQLEIHLPVPPTTTESRQAAASQATAKGDAALFTLNQARGTQKKRLRALQLARKVGPDELKRANKEMERINKEAEVVMGRIVEEKRRVLLG